MHTILIIEDDPVVAHIYRMRCEKEGFKVEVASDGQAGYYRIYDLKPDAVLLDLMLPKMNGIDLLKKIRAVREFEKLPVLVFTNAYVANMIHEAFSAGANAVYNKSNVTPRQIIDVFLTILAPNPGTPSAVVAPPSTTSARPAGTTTAATAARAGNGDDASFQAKMLTDFKTGATAWINDMRKALQDVSKSPDETTRVAQIEVLYGKARSFANNAGLAGLGAVTRLADATEALVLELIQKPRNITPSVLRTLAHALDTLGGILQSSVPAQLLDQPPVQVLVVDDEPLSRRAVTTALEKAFLKSVAVQNAEEALRQTALNTFDLILLDVNMPGMDGFTLCATIRADGLNKAAPIVFVTSASDFHARAQSTLRGGNDLIAKPFLFLELTVKALTFALRNRVEQVRREVATRSKAESEARLAGATA
jgi:CheY-like chemotaxis protein